MHTDTHTYTGMGAPEPRMPYAFISAGEIIPDILFEFRLVFGYGIRDSERAVGSEKSSFVCQRCETSTHVVEHLQLAGEFRLILVHSM